MPTSSSRWPKKAATFERGVILDTENVDAAKAAVEAIKDVKPILNGANKDNLPT